MTTVQLRDIAHAKSGDKGDTANIGVIAYDPKHYDLLKQALTVERVKEHFTGIVHGDVTRFELPNLDALNFLLDQALGGGGTTSLRVDPQGKTIADSLLLMEIYCPEDLA